MKYLILIFAIAFASCKDSRFDESTIDQIRGEWVRENNPNRHYIFAEDYATTWISDFGTILAPQWFRMRECEPGAVELSEINSDLVQVWAFTEIQGDSLATVEDQTGPLSFTFKIRRVK